MNGCVVVAHQLGEELFQQGVAAPGVVVGDARVDVVADMGGADAVMQQVEQRSIGAIHRLKRTFSPAPLGRREMGDRHIGVLQPGVNRQPGIDDQIRQAIGAENGSGACLSTNEKAIKRLKPSFCTKGEYAKKNEPQLCLEY